MDWVFTYTDCSGNTVDWTYTYTIDIPAFTVPADGGSTVNCLADAQVQPAAPAVNDQCGNALTPVITTPVDIPCEGTMDWVFTYTDCAGNTADWTYTYTIDIPAFALPFADAGSTVNCLVDAQVQPTPPAAVTDQCGNTLTPVVTTPADIPCEGAMDWIFTYTDCAGNTVDWTYTYTIDIPVFTLPADGSENVVCIGDVYVPTPPVMNDGCGNPITPVMSENTDPVCVGDKIYTFTYTDCSGNTADWTYTFSINDNVPPTGTAPADINIVLGDPIPAADPTLITDEADNCAAVPTVVHVSDVSDGGACPEIITRTYEIEDACGNTTQVTQLITIGDGVLPTASDPAPITVECLADVPAPDETVVIDEADNGPVPTVTWEDDTPVGTCPTIIDRRYRVTDNCGNFIFVTQTITVIPSTNPVISIVDGSSVVNCLADAQVQPVYPAVNDVCGYAITPVVTTPVDVVCEGDMTWVFTYTDCAGNSSVWNYTYTIDLPAFTLPPNDGQIVNCLADAVVPTPPVMTDLCGNSITPVMSENADPACEGDKIYTFTYTDCSGNTADWVYTYTIDIPAFTLLANGSESVVCIGDVYIPTPPSVDDMCGNAITPVMIENADPVCVGDKIYTFTYTDCAGNTADWTYTFSINDNVPPTGTAPADIILNVGTPIPPADPTLITDEADNCAAVPTVVHVSDLSDGGSCPENITRTYEIEDACGNTTQVTQLITIGDIVDPTASNPLPVNVECIFDVPAPDISVVTDEADNSGIAPVVAHVGDASDGQTCPETITRTYSVTDVCGNQITVEQVITVNDVTAPTATAPATVNVECIGDVPPADINIITDEADNCTAIPVVDHVGDVSDGLSCPETITRTYSITDDCGNVTTVDQLIIVNDITPPTATAPATVNVECIGDVPPADINVITDEADNCTVNPVVVHVGDVSDGQSCPETITRTYSITDDCGNSITVDQLIIVNDITPPTASNPAPISVPGAPLVPAPDPSVVIDEADNCIVAPTVTWVSDVSDGNICNMEVITRTYSIMDDCGNEIFVTQEITIEAVPPPIDAGLDTLICSDGMATLTADNPWGVPISWDNGVTDGVPFSPNGNAVYTVTADNYGCISTDDVTVTIEQIPTIMFSGDQLSGCEPLTVTFINNSLAESAFDNCVWEFSNGTTLTGCSDVTYTFENGGLYDVTLTTTTVNGCVNSDTYTDYVYAEDIPLAGFIPNSTIISNLNPEINFVNTTADAAPGTAYSWTFGDGSPIIYSESPTHLFPEENSGSYEVEMIATSPLGCIDTAYGYVRVVEEVIFYVPNTFTPDSDNFNEYFQPIFTSGYDPYDFNLFIFNRWGEIIWESHDASVGWDGTYGGKLVQDGTYTWTIEFKTSESDERIYVNGHLNVIK
jgi:gliding motility-associated-like protein